MLVLSSLDYSVKGPEMGGLKGAVMTWLEWSLWSNHLGMDFVVALINTACIGEGQVSLQIS